MSIFRWIWQSTDEPASGIESAAGGNKQIVADPRNLRHEHTT
jgi:hypothetical protein